MLWAVSSGCVCCAVMSTQKKVRSGQRLRGDKHRLQHWRTGRVNDSQSIWKAILPAVSVGDVWVSEEPWHTPSLLDVVACVTYLRNPLSVSLFEGLIPSWVTGGHNGKASAGRGVASDIHTWLALCLSFSCRKSTSPCTEPEQTINDRFHLTSKGTI